MLNVDLFENIDTNSVMELLKCIGIKTKVFKNENYIVKINDKIDYLGVILEGNAVITKENNSIIEVLKTNDIFGHNIVCCGLKKSPVNIISKDKCEVLFLPFEKVVTPCAKLCPYHIKLIKNIMKMISKRNSLLTDKIDIIGQKTIRDKVFSLLNTYKIKGESFTIPYSREQMAKFLCTDRSALSRELCKMRDEGLIKFDRNTFQILNCPRKFCDKEREQNF